MRDNSYITIQSWMVDKLHLKGNNLLVYAIIYGFSQDRESVFSGRLKYLEEWCSATKSGIEKNLKYLLDRKLITKTFEFENGIKRCKYSTILDNFVYHTGQLSCPNINNKYKLENKKKNIKKKFDDNFAKHNYTSEDLNNVFDDIDKVDI